MWYIYNVDFWSHNLLYNVSQKSIIISIIIRAILFYRMVSHMREAHTLHHIHRTQEGTTLNTNHQIVPLHQRSHWTRMPQYLRSIIPNLMPNRKTQAVAMLWHTRYEIETLWDTHLKFYSVWWQHVPLTEFTVTIRERIWDQEEIHGIRWYWLENKTQVLVTNYNCTCIQCDHFASS